MRTIADTLRWKTWGQQFEDYLKTRVMTDDALDDDIRRQSILDQEEKEFNSAIYGKLVSIVSGAPPDFRGDAPGIRGRFFLILRFKV